MASNISVFMFICVTKGPIHVFVHVFESCQSPLTEASQCSFKVRVFAERSSFACTCQRQCISEMFQRVFCVELIL